MADPSHLSEPCHNQSAKRHVRRKMTQQEKIDYRRRRLLRACKECASSKRKCNHDLSERNLTSTRSEDGAALHGGRTESSHGLVTPAASYTGDDVHQIQDNASLEFKDQLPAYSQLPYEEKLGQHTSEASLLIHKPQSPETLTAMLFVDNINCEGVADAWFNEIPARLGEDACLDQAIAALQMTCWYRRRLPGATLPKVYQTLAGALEVLKINMVTEDAAFDDHTLASIAALSPVEAIRAGNSFLIPTHLDGMTSVLVSRAALAPLSEIGRRILEYHFCDTYVMAALRGLVSPLENIDNSYCTPFDIHRPPAERKIRTIGNRLCVHLPRLIALVRMAREEETMSSVTVSSALSLAEELLQFKDEVSESEYLYYVGVARTLRTADPRVTKYSLQFQSISSFEAGAYYWHTRAAILRLCRRLRLFFGNMCDVYSLPTISQIREELERCASNIQMTAEFAQTLTARKRRRLFAQGMVSCWGIYKDYPDLFSSDEEREHGRAWVLENCNSALLGSNSALTAKDMDEAAELFVGGPLTGMYKDLYDPT